MNVILANGFPDSLDHSRYDGTPEVDALTAMRRNKNLSEKLRPSIVTGPIFRWESHPLKYHCFIARLLLIGLLNVDFKEGKGAGFFSFHVQHAGKLEYYIPGSHWIDQAFIYALQI